jgi:hypothetical protein
MNPFVALRAQNAYLEAVSGQSYQSLYCPDEATGRMAAAKLLIYAVTLRDVPRPRRVSTGESWIPSEVPRSDFPLYRRLPLLF